ncbi:trypsin-like serine protease [Streptomyces kaniharaensis]|uniref:Trypsin-like serine protease n=1 Tax=Streptomyces kaniharaensis TaxID=212423 RepID=A0A6N7KHU5_9ACTN|nr:RICIN domain-containing protein [Streptomyces kaniharaensis]MQS10946.1 trypsin-like serine protease [Streptomyces kaniharaensis]
MFRSRPRAAWMTGMLASAAVVGSLVSAGTANALIGDSVPNGTYAFTTKLDIGGQRSCTGSLVDPYWVLTASSCFADDPAQPQALQAGAPKLKTVATVGRTDLTTNAGFSSEVTQLVPRADRDLVLVKLAQPAQGIPTVKVGAAPTAGETLTVAGYGRTKDEWVPNTLHSASFTVQSSTATTVAVTGKTAGKDAICKGDTGGPALRATTGGGVELAGVNSLSWQGGCLGSGAETRTGAVETRVDDLASWVFDTRLHTASLKNNYSGLCAYVPWQTPQDMANLVQVGCDRQYVDQIWDLQKVDGGYSLRNVKSNKCAYVPWQTPNNGAEVVQIFCDPQYVDQVWKLEPVSGGGYQLRNVKSNKCMTGWSREAAAGQKLTQFDCIPEYSDQVFTI